MPKRKCEKEADDLNNLSRKLKKLEKKIKRCRRPRIMESSSSSSSSSSRETSPIPQNTKDGDREDDLLTFNDARDDSLADIVDRSPPRAAPPPPAAAGPAPADTAVPSTSAAAQTDSNDATDEVLDSLLLEILGVDPSTVVKYGSDINKDVATRFEHLATNGLDKDVRKELTSKYLVPGNCVLIGAPNLNAEIKAALPETMVKRDKAIEARQRQLATAIACLAGTMTDQLKSTEKNHDLLRKLMDIGRLLCDLQHAESLTRRKFAVFSLKKDMKEHLTNTKIDKSLFGENLSDTLKTAKAVNKSGTDLKVQSKTNKKPSSQPQKSQAETKNWRGQGPARKPPAAAAAKTREPASRRNQPAASSKQSSPPQRQTRRQ